MSPIPKITREEMERRQQARGEVTIETVRDFVLANPELSPEQAAFQLSHLYPQYSYEQSLQATRLIQQLKDIVEKDEAGHPN